MNVIKGSKLGWQIGAFPQEAIGNNEIALTVARMRSWTIDHPAKKPIAVQRRNGSQLVVAGASRKTEVLGQRAVGVKQHQQWLRSFGYALAGWVLNIASGTEREISPTGQRCNIEQDVASIDIDYVVRTGSSIAGDKRSICIPAGPICSHFGENSAHQRESAPRCA